jgi:hypothetical protein
MTLINGIDDEHRKAPYWPRSVPTTASIQACRDWCAEHLQGFHTGRSGDFLMAQDTSAKVETVNNFTIWLKPFDEAKSQEMRAIRNQLSEVLEIREPGHDSYRFHLSLGYLIEYLSQEEAAAFAQFYRKAIVHLSDVVPVLRLGQPEFCVFQDMFAFDPMFTLKD